MLLPEEPLFERDISSTSHTEEHDFTFRLSTTEETPVAMKVTVSDHFPSEESSSSFLSYVMDVDTPFKEERPLVNVYPGDPMAIAIADYTWEIANHGVVNAALEQFAAERLAYAVPSTTYVSGSADGKDLYLRIDGPVTNRERLIDSPDARFQVVSDYVQRFGRAVEISNTYSAEQGGRVYIEPVSSSNQEYLRTAQMLGLTHTMLAPIEFSLSAANKAVRGCWQENTPIPHYYARGVGTRYITPGQLAVLDSLVEDREGFLRALLYLRENMDESKISKTAQVRELLFLIVHPETREPTNVLLHQSLYADLCELTEFCQKDVLPEEWNDRAGDIRSRLTPLIETHAAANPALFRSDNLSNPEYVQTLSRILRGQVDQRGLDDLGAEFSTPLRALEVGLFPVDQLGVARDFQFTTESPQLQGVVEHYLKVAQQSERVLDWITLWTPTTPLTREVRTSSFRSQFGYPQDRSFVVTYGGVREAQQTVEVVREHLFGRDYWDAHRQRKEEAGPLDSTWSEFSQFSSGELTRMVNAFFAAQFDLFNQLAGRLPDGQGFSVPPFESFVLDVAGHERDFQKRPLIPGERLDFEHRTALSSESLEAYVHCFGYIAAVNFLAQRPLISPHEILIQARNDKRLPTRMISIGVSDAFSNLVPANSPEEYLEKTCWLYGTHLAAWAAAAEFGKESLSADPPDLVACKEDLYIMFYDTFTRSLSAIADGGKLDTSNIQKIFSRGDILASNVPSAFSIVDHLELTNDLMERAPEFYADRMIEAARKLEKLFRVAVGSFSSEKDANESLDFREEVISDLSSLLIHHYSDPARFQRIQRLLLSEELPFTALSRFHWEELLFVADVLLAVEAVVGDEMSDFLEYTESTDTSIKYAREINQRFPHAYLDADVARRFHSSYNNLQHVVTGSNDAAQQTLRKALNILLPEH